jgi:hypothetical protein
MPDDTDMTAGQFYATRSAGSPARIVTSRAQFLVSVGNGGMPSALTLPPGHVLPPVVNPLDEIRVGHPGLQGALAVR